jgi:GNAT superfamily N-acetyltransferase
MEEIRLLESPEELRASYRVMSQLRSHLTEDEYMACLAQQREAEHYHVVGLSDQSGKFRAVGGFRLATALAHGKFLYVDDLVSDRAARSKGYGKKLLDWIGRYGKEHGCASLHLDSGVQRHDAHRFYLRERMEIVFYHFRKNLD